MKVPNFNKVNLKLIRADIDQALEKVAKSYGISLKAGNARFTNETVTFKLEGIVAAKDGSLKTKGEIEFKKNAHMYGFSPEDFGKPFKTPGGQMFTIAGLNPKAHKFPVQALEQVTKRMYKMSAKSVLQFIGKKDSVSLFG